MDIGQWGDSGGKGFISYRVHCTIGKILPCHITSRMHVITEITDSFGRYSATPRGKTNRILKPFFFFFLLSIICVNLISFTTTSKDTSINYSVLGIKL